MIQRIKDIRANHGDFVNEQRFKPLKLTITSEVLPPFSITGDNPKWKPPNGQMEHAMNGAPLTI
jgi:hypothetical protein